LSPTESELRVLLDKQAIYEVLITYCRGVDRCDIATVDSVYHQDSVDDHGYWKGAGKDFAPFVVNRLREANIATTHSVTNVLIEVDGAAAWSESQVMVHLLRRDTDPVETDVMGARYLDRLERRDGAWRISDRTVVLDWNTKYVWKAEAPAMPLDDFAKGSRGERGDPVFGFMPSLRDRAA
jgi:hypothetical protein